MMDDATIRKLPAKVGAGDAIIYKGGTWDGPHDDTDEYQLPPEYHDGYWMRWDEWVAFAEKIIEADKAAREPAPGEIVRFDTRLGAKTPVTLLKLEGEDNDEIWLTAMKTKGHVPIMDEKGQVEWFALEEDIHNGPGCSSCGWSCCMHCNGPEDIPQCIGTLEN